MTTNSCNLRCDYCVPAGTNVVDSKFRNVKIEDISEGDIVLGFDEHTQRYKHRRIAPAVVTKTFKRKSKVIEILLKDGNSLKITENHPILGYRVGNKGWKDSGKFKEGQQIYVFNLPEAPEMHEYDEDYKIGYSIGVMLGDGSIKKYVDKNGYDMYKIRLAVKDDEIIDRSQKFLGELGIDLYRKPFLISKKHNMYKNALFGNKREIYKSLKDLISINMGTNESDSYYKGFLAGIYDAEGSIDRRSRVIRIFNFDKKILEEVSRSLEYLGFTYTTEWNGIRIKSSVKGESLRFVKTVEPACKRKSYEAFWGMSLLTRSKVVEIKDIDEEIDVYNIETTSSTYIANGFAVHNCYESLREGETTLGVGKKAIDWLRSQGKTGRWKHVTFFGGEPLLKPKLIKGMIEYGLKGPDPIDKFSILSNGTICNEEVMETLRYMKDNCSQAVLQVSLDGGRESHDKHRKFQDGRGSFDIIMSNIPKFQEIIPSIIFRQTVCPENVPNLSKDFKMMLDMSGPEGNVSLTPIVEGGWAPESVAIYIEELAKIMDIYRKTNKPTFFNLIHGTKDRLCYQEARDMRGCSAGRHLACVTVEGDIYPCHRFASYKHIVDLNIGNIYDGIDTEGKNYNDVINAFGTNNKCNKCRATNCNACMATNIAMGHGLDFNPPEGYCQMAIGGNKTLEDATIEFVRDNRILLRYGEIMKIGEGGFCRMEDNKNTEYVDNQDLFAQALNAIIHKMKELKTDTTMIKKHLGIELNQCPGESNDCTVH